ncbi:MAG: hypothetical protein JWO53_997 [Chlamydiia bacterium]|nr:hypothetical protein [Chlamydiia bacterium]
MNIHKIQVQPFLEQIQSPKPTETFVEERSFVWRFAVWDQLSQMSNEKIKEQRLRVQRELRFHVAELKKCPSNTELKQLISSSYLTIRYLMIETYFRKYRDTIELYQWDMAASLSVSFIKMYEFEEVPIGFCMPAAIFVTESIKGKQRGVLAVAVVLSSTILLSACINWLDNEKYKQALISSSVGGFTLYTGMQCAGLSDRFFNRLTELSRIRPILSETLKCAAGTSFGAFGGIVGTMLLGASLPSLGASLVLGGASYLASRTFKWIGGYFTKEVLRFQVCYTEDRIIKEYT